MEAKGAPSCQDQGRFRAIAIATVDVSSEKNISTHAPNVYTWGIPLTSRFYSSLTLSLRNQYRHQDILYTVLGVIARAPASHSHRQKHEQNLRWAIFVPYQRGMYTERPWAKEILLIIASCHGTSAMSLQHSPLPQRRCLVAKWQIPTWR